MTILGIDVARYQPTNPDPASTIPNVQFYFAKATQGTTPDPTYAAHIAHARAAHIPVVGAYHYGDKRIDPIAQLNAFLAIAGKVGAYALDEEGSNALTYSQARIFITGLKKRVPKAILYHSDFGFPDYGQDLDWVANYSHKPARHWDFWQYGPAAPHVDGDRYNGTTNQMLKALGLQTSSTTYIAYISLLTPLYNRFGVRTGTYVHGGGTRLVVSHLTRINGFYFYKILQGDKTGYYLHAGSKTFVVNKVVVNG